MRPARLILLVTVAIILAATVGCVRQDDNADQAAESATGQGMELTDAGRERQRAPDAASEQPSDRLPSLDPRDNAFAAQRMSSRPIDPIDSILGPLSTIGLAARALDARDAAERLLPAAIAGEEEAIAALPRSVQDGAIRLADAVAVGESVRLRIAPPDLGDREEAFVRFRVVGDGVDLVGELVLETAEGEWYIADIQIAEAVSE